MTKSEKLSAISKSKRKTPARKIDIYSRLTHFFVVLLSRHGWLKHLGIICLFCIISFAAYWPIYPGDPSHLPGCVCGDTVQSVWFLRWVPYALMHGHNPLFTNWLNVPYGANLAQNTLMPLLGLITSPLSLVVSPVASFNLIAWLAFPLSACAMYYVCYKITGSRIASFVSGLLYGFSPYMIGQGQGHIMLTFVPIPPLILFLSWHLFVLQDQKPHKNGILLAAAIIGQFFIDPEILALTFIAIIVPLLGVLVFRYKAITNANIFYVLKSLRYTLAICFLILIYPVWFMVLGPHHFTGPNFAPGNPYRSDFIGLIAPTMNERIIPNGIRYFASHTEDLSYSESGDYMGIPLLAFIIWGAIRWRRNVWIFLLSSSALICWILSLGPRLLIDTSRTPIILPFAVLTKLPLLQDILPSRISLAEWLLISIATSLIIMEAQHNFRNLGQSLNSKHKIVYDLCVLVILLVLLVPLLPRWPYPAKKISIPSLYGHQFISTETPEIALTYPLPVFPNDQAMLWQALSGMRFKLIGAYIQNPSMYNTESEYPLLLPPQSVEEWLNYEQEGQSSPWLSQAQISTSDLTTFLSRYDVNTVMIDTNAPQATLVITTFRSSIGKPSILDGVAIWRHVQNRL